MTVDQRNATAVGDIVGRDKHEHHHAPPAKLSTLEQLKARLRKEVEDGNHCIAVIDQLVHYQKPVVLDGVEGLRAKLEVSGRADQLITALAMKEELDGGS